MMVDLLARMPRGATPLRPPHHHLLSAFPHPGQSDNSDPNRKPLFLHSTATTNDRNTDDTRHTRRAATLLARFGNNKTPHVHTRTQTQLLSLLFFFVRHAAAAASAAIANTTAAANTINVNISSLPPFSPRRSHAERHAAVGVQRLADVERRVLFVLVVLFRWLQCVFF